jgi:TonB family protein
MLTTAQAADARTINELAQFRQRARAEQALRLAMFGRSVRLTDPGLDEAAMPTKEDLVRVFPAKASAAKRDGQAVMSCRVMRDGALSACHILAEVPPDYGFGQAAIELSKLLRGKPATLNGEPIGGAEIRFALGFDPAWL